MNGAWCKLAECWHGFDLERFLFEEQEALIVFPQEGTAIKRLAVKTEYWDAFPNTEIQLIEKGFHLCYLKNKNRWGIDEDLDRKARFVRFVAEKYHLNQKTVPIGMSCGGLIAIKFAAKYPELVSCLYLDAPVLNYMSCPCGFGAGAPLDGERGVVEILNALNLTLSQLISYRDMPMDKLPQLMNQRIPVVMVAGDADGIVPYEENGSLLQQAYESAGIDFKLFIKPGCGHHPHGLEDCRAVVDFILSHK